MIYNTNIFSSRPGKIDTFARDVCDYFWANLLRNQSPHGSGDETTWNNAHLYNRDQLKPWFFISIFVLNKIPQLSDLSAMHNARQREFYSSWNWYLLKEIIEKQDPTMQFYHRFYWLCCYLILNPNSNSTCWLRNCK